MILSGKVALADGTPLAESAAIQTICKGQKRTETHTDSHGNFSFQLGGGFSSTESALDVESPAGKASQGRPERRDLQGCELQASLAGFTSDIVELDGHLAQSGNVNVGRIGLHRLQNVEGLTISATTAQAPTAARKAWEKGQEQAEEGKLEEAQKSLQKAVAIYPNFAAAWFELGSVQGQRNDFAGARHSFQQSIAADSKYINPYFGLSRLALRGQNWRELTESSEKALALNPVSFPDAWFWNGLGNYQLQNFIAAEKSARHGLEVDPEHHVPKLEYLLGILLSQRSQYEEATRHLRVFLSLATKARDIAEAQKQLDEIARLSADANLAAEKK